MLRTYIMMSGYLQYLLLGFLAIKKNLIFTGESANVCTPEDMMNLNLGYDETNESLYSLEELPIGYEGYRNKSLYCNDECFRIDYLTTITSGNINKKAVNNFINKTGLEINDSG